MTEFKDLELIYNQFFNLTDEISKMIKNEDYGSAISKLKDKDKLISKILSARKTVDFTEEQSQKLSEMEKIISENEHEILSSLEKLHDEVGEAIKMTKKKVKINSAYTMPSDKEQGRIVDFSE